MKNWDRIRFKANLEDPRPVVFPPPGPYWISGESNEKAVVIAFFPSRVKVKNVLTFWPEAEDIQTLEADISLFFTDRFQRPDWWKES